MTMQTDVKQARVGNSGWIVTGPCRIKGIAFRNADTGVGLCSLFDTDVTPVDATYSQNTTTVTVTKTAHGIVTGDTVSISYNFDASNNVSTNGTYIATKLTADTFTLTDPNSYTVAANTTCNYVTGDNRWITVHGVASGDIYNNFELFPGEGVRAAKKVYAVVSNFIAVRVFYG